MDTVDRYLAAVKRYLPARERDDIAAELCANLAAEIEDRESALGRPLDVSERAATLRAHGHPMAVALRYRSTGASFTFGRQLVGPALFPFYVKVLALNAAVACIIALAAVLYDIPSWRGFSNVLAHLLLVFAAVTVAFIALQRYVDGRGHDWRAQDGATERRTGRVSRLESISTLFWFIGSTVLLVDVLRSNDLFLHERGSMLVLTPVWHQILLPYAVIVVLEIVRNSINLARPEMMRFRALMIAIAGCAGIVAIAMLLHAGSLVTASNAANAHQVAVASIVNRGVFISLIAAAVTLTAVIVWRMNEFFFRAIRPRPSLSHRPL